MRGWAIARRAPIFRRVQDPSMADFLISTRRPRRAPPTVPLPSRYQEISSPRVLSHSSTLTSLSNHAVNGSSLRGSFSPPPGDCSPTNVSPTRGSPRPRDPSQVPSQVSLSPPTGAQPRCSVAPNGDGTLRSRWWNPKIVQELVVPLEDKHTNDPLLRNAFDEVAVNGLVSIEQLPAILDATKVHANTVEVEDALKLLPQRPQESCYVTYSQTAALLRHLQAPAPRQVSWDIEDHGFTESSVHHEYAVGQKHPEKNRSLVWLLVFTMATTLTIVVAVCIPDA